MRLVDVVDPADLSAGLPIWIYGAGDVGQSLLHLLSNYSSFRVTGFLDTFKHGEWCGLPIRALADWQEDPRAVTVILATLDEARVLPALASKGVARVFRLHPEPLLKEAEQTRNLHYLPEALPDGVPTHPLREPEARLRAAAARLLVKRRELDDGYRKLRRLALDSGWIHVEDDIAGCALRQSGEQHLLVRFWDAAVRRGILPGEVLAQAQQRARDRGLPAVLINTMLKSGTGYLTKVLTERLELPQFFITLRGSPNDWMLPDYLRRFAQGGALSVQHLDASAVNLDHLAAAGVRKIYLHVRDPRQATVSYLHHLENNLVGDIFALRNWIQPFLPANYAQLSWELKVEWHARNHVPGLIHWLQEWVHTAAHDPRFEILMIDFNEFRQDEARAINRVLEFYGIDSRISAADLPAKKDVPHFRSGQAEEWREVFSARQRAILSAMMPAEWFTRFGWVRD